MNIMGKKTNFLRNSTTTEVLWPKDFLVQTPQLVESGSTNKARGLTSSRASDFKAVVEKLLETLIHSVNASFGLARILPAHGQTHQFISTAGLPLELLTEESDLDLNCEKCGTSAIKNRIYSSNIGICKTRRDCRYVSCQIQSIIAASLDSHQSTEKPLGTLSLFFEAPQKQDANVSSTILSFASLLSTLIEHNIATSEAKRIDLIAERQSIANEIHDSLAQSLVYARMRTSLLLEAIRTHNELMVTKYAHDMDEALENSQKTVRELITDFRCSIDPSGLLHALKSLTEKFRIRNEIQLEYVNNVAHFELPIEFEIQISHIVQEALANIATHSGATHARLTVDHTGDYYVFNIEDNGSGGCTFAPVEGHYGMMIMRERAQRIGGEIKVESSKGIGTRVQLFFPEPGSDWREANE